jgi:hypothetical protein
MGLLVTTTALEVFNGGRFSLPDKPTGLSAAEYASSTILRPRCLPLLKFDDNTAHR